MALGAVVSAIVSGMLVNVVDAAVWQGPPAGTPPANNRPFVIWNSEDAGLQQTDASISVDGMLMLGSAASVLAPSENLIYGNTDTSSTGNLLLLQTESVDRFRVTTSGDATFAGDVKASGCFGATFVGLTPTLYHGSLGAVGSYYAADNRCQSAFPGAHVCRPEEILESISCSVPGDPIRTIANGSMGWVNGGPPGHTSNGNDCNGWQSTAATHLGKFWIFHQTTGGTGTQTTCNAAGGLRFSCCR